MFEVVSDMGISDVPESRTQFETRVELNARRGGLIHGTRVATVDGWTPIEDIQPGDLIRTVENGFKAVRRISVDTISVPTEESRIEYLPVRVPPSAVDSPGAIWIMPEQGIALEHGTADLTVVAARKLSGLFRIKSDVPASSFDVSALFFDEDEVVYMEGGMRAFCPSGRFGGHSGTSAGYQIAESETAAELVEDIRTEGRVAALANPLGALPAPISLEQVVPLRPSRGARRPGRPGRPLPVI
ncbi:Hint domain-containing protein [Ruegeria faecimaris]|uniref:Hint domain-containing protein n=1 Tax=Ruegeria faecimaris TaxID=686389 RepID=UPI002330E3D8|nr:Hint domain-containing protein [Ruegeria faecimaris]